MIYRWLSPNPSGIKKSTWISWSVFKCLPVGAYVQRHSVRVFASLSVIKFWRYLPIFEEFFHDLDSTILHLLVISASPVENVFQNQFIFPQCNYVLELNGTGSGADLKKGTVLRISQVSQSNSRSEIYVFKLFKDHISDRKAKTRRILYIAILFEVKCFCFYGWVFIAM